MYVDPTPSNPRRHCRLTTKDENDELRSFSLGFDGDFAECGAVIEAEHGIDWLSPLPINPKLDSLQIYTGDESLPKLFRRAFCT